MNGDLRFGQSRKLQMDDVLRRLRDTLRELEESVLLPSGAPPQIRNRWKIENAQIRPSRFSLEPEIGQCRLFRRLLAGERHEDAHRRNRDDDCDGPIHYLR
jgi:hypothetical protein